MWKSTGETLNSDYKLNVFVNAAGITPFFFYPISQYCISPVQYQIPIAYLQSLSAWSVDRIQLPAGYGQHYIMALFAWCCHLAAGAISFRVSFGQCFSFPFLFSVFYTLRGCCQANRTTFVDVVDALETILIRRWCHKWPKQSDP